MTSPVMISSTCGAPCERKVIFLTLLHKDRFAKRHYLQYEKKKKKTNNGENLKCILSTLRTSRGSRSELLRQRQEVGSVCFIAEDSLLVFCKENTVLLQIKKHEGKNLCIWQSLREGFYHRWSRGCDVSCRWSVQMRHLLVNLGFLSFSPSLTHVEGRSCHPSSEVICSFPYKTTLDHATERKRN